MRKHKRIAIVLALLCVLAVLFLGRLVRGGRYYRFIHSPDNTPLVHRAVAVEEWKSMEEGADSVVSLGFARFSNPFGSITDTYLYGNRVFLKFQDGELFFPSPRIAEESQKPFDIAIFESIAGDLECIENNREAFHNKDTDWTEYFPRFESTQNLLREYLNYINNYPFDYVHAFLAEMPVSVSSVLRMSEREFARHFILVRLKARILSLPSQTVLFRTSDYEGTLVHTLYEEDSKNMIMFSEDSKDKPIESKVLIKIKEPSRNLLQILQISMKNKQASKDSIQKFVSSIRYEHDTIPVSSLTFSDKAVTELVRLPGFHTDADTLKEYIEEGDAELFRTLLAYVPDINENILWFRGEDCISGKANLLHAASASGSMDIVRDLLERGADLHSQTDQGQTPLFIAVLCDDFAMTKLLLEKGASREEKDLFGFTPSSLAESAEVAGLFGAEERYHEPAEVCKQWRISAEDAKKIVVDHIEPQTRTYFDVIHAKNPQIIINPIESYYAILFPANGAETMMSCWARVDGRTGECQYHEVADPISYVDLRTILRSKGNCGGSLISKGMSWVLAKQAFIDRGYHPYDNTNLQVEAYPEFFKGFFVDLPGDRILILSPDANMEHVNNISLEEEASRGKWAQGSHEISQIDLNTLEYRERY